MRSKLGKAVRNQFKKRMNICLPQFNEVPDAIVPQGWKVYGLEMATKLNFYITLAIMRKDSFTLEGAWTCNKRFPSDTSTVWPGALPRKNAIREKVKNGEFAFRIGELWNKGGHTWDLVQQQTLDEMIKEQDAFLETGIIPPEPSLGEAMAKVNPMVDDAIGRIEQYLLPYFDEVAQQFGYKDKISDLTKIFKTDDDRNDK